MELSIEQALHQGVAAQNIGDLQKAEGFYREILGRYPKHPDASHNLGLIAISVNQIEAALPLFKTALEVNPMIEQFWVSYVDALVKDNQIKDAKQTIKKAVKKGFNRKKLETLLSQSNLISDTKVPSKSQIDSLLKLYQSGRLADVEKLALLIIKNFPSHYFAWQLLASVLRQCDRDSEAANAFETLLTLIPQDAVANYNFGNTLNRLGRFDDAEVRYRQAIALKNDFAEAHGNLANMLQQLGRLGQAITSYTRAIELRPDDAETHKNLGSTLLKLDRLDEAEAVFRKAIALKPDFADAHNYLGSSVKELGRLDEAEAVFRRAIELKPDFSDAHNNLGSLLKELGRLNEAEASFRKVIALGIGCYEAHRNLASILRALGKIEQANESDRYAVFLSSSDIEEAESKDSSDTTASKNPSSIEYPELYRVGMGTENVGGFLRAMAQMLRPKNILEVGAGYTTPFLLEALVNNERVYDDGNLQASYFKNYCYDSKLVIIDNMSLGELINKPGMEEIISSKYTEFVEGSFEGKAGSLHEKYGSFDFVWFDCGGSKEYYSFINEYWDICSGYIFFHYTYSEGSPNELHNIILNNVTGNPSIFDIIEPHKTRQGSITMVKKNNLSFNLG